VIVDKATSLIRPKSRALSWIKSPDTTRSWLRTAPGGLDFSVQRALEQDGFGYRANLYRCALTARVIAVTPER
jgi:hypothetical protein